MKKSLDENVLKSLCTSAVYQRGELLFHSDAVFNTFRDKEVLKGNCLGKSEAYYEIEVELEEGQIVDSFCSCPYDWDGYCKHLIALLLAYIHEPMLFIEVDYIKNQLLDMDREVLVNFLLESVQTLPYGYEWLQKHIQGNPDHKTVDDSPEDMVR